MALQHFSHEHPLVLNEANEKTDDNSAGEEVPCNGCRKSILPGDFTYSCSIGCLYFLHKKCAEMPKEIKHLMHSKHRLTLLAVLPPHYGGEFTCDLCQFPSSGFTYNCRLCEFDVDLNCAFPKYSFRHEAHDHELNVVQRPASFHCDACDSKTEDLSYRCTICPFWMHKSCASSPNIIYPSFHDHPLILSYFIPEPYLTFDQYCNICRKKMNPAYWLYMCGGCRIFAHMKCATSTAGTMVLRDGKSEIEADDQRDLDPIQVKFPVLDESSLDRIMLQFIEGISLEAKEINMLKARDLFTLWSTTGMRKSETEVDKIINLRMSRFVGGISRSTEESNEIKYLMMSKFVEGLSLSAEESDGIKDLLMSKFIEGISLSAEEITESDLFIHFNHIGHPLILQNKDKDNENDKMLICDGCLKHISDEEYPYIACLWCNFVLHQTCAKLPMELKHPIFHPEHQLKLYRIPNRLFPTMCWGCRNYSNGFFYHCDSCNIGFDLKCATLPKTIKHEAHKHPLIQTILLVTDRKVFCRACWYWINGMEYSCEACDFHVHAGCATSFPGKVIHKWDDHPILLVYGSVQDHPDVFYCEICEEEINPKHWLYFCQECDQSFHPLCLYPFFEYENIKFGKKYKFDSHPHDLTFICSNRFDRHSLTSLRYQSANKYPSTCNSCKIWSDKPVFECAPCNFVLCEDCVWERPGDSM